MSARNANGSATRIASSVVARTSRVIAPNAVPTAPKATPPTSSASTQPAIRAQRRSSNSAITPSSTSVATTAAIAPSSTFSISSSQRDTGPRMRRPNTCSSRSSASIPPPRNSPMIISVTAAASAIDHRLQAPRQVGGDDQRRDRVAAAHGVDRLLAALDADRVDGLEQLVGVLGRVDLLRPDPHAERIARHVVEERDLRLGVVA